MSSHMPSGSSTVAPYLVVSDDNGGASGLIDFLSNVFDARERRRVPASDERIMHAEHDLDLARIILGEKAFQILGQARLPQMQGLQDGYRGIGGRDRITGPHEAARQKGSRQGIACADKRKTGKKAARPDE